MGRSKITICLAISLAVIIGLASADLEQDRKECASQLVGLSTCLPYVSDEAQAPSADCCAGLKQVLENGRKCLCVLVKDRDDTSLGLKINGTRAVTLPNTCHLPSNISDCINLLHLSPDSPDAKMFKEIANLTKGSGTSFPSAPVTSGNSTAERDSSGSEKTWPSSIPIMIIYSFLPLWAVASFVF